MRVAVGKTSFLVLFDRRDKNPLSIRFKQHGSISIDLPRHLSRVVSLSDGDETEHRFYLCR
jgi:hypothetical protein